MLTRALLAPRHFRIDDLLRRPYTSDACFGPSGPHLSGRHPDGWGLANGLHFNGAGDFGLFRLEIQADGETIHPAEAISRPSHLTLHGVSSDSVQVTEDKFITDRDVAVSVLSLRNAGLYDAEVRIDLTWLLGDGMQTLGETSAYVLREAPPGDDLHLHLPTQSYRILTFLTSVAQDRDAARRTAWSVFDAEEVAFPRRMTHYVLPDANPLLSHTRRYQQWFDQHMPRFDGPDPWLMKLWYHGWQQQRQIGGTIPPDYSTSSTLQNVPEEETEAIIRGQFVNADFDRPRCDTDGMLWNQVILHDILGVSVLGNTVVVQPAPLVAVWDYFCLENLSVGPDMLTLVWDAPTSTTDFYDDGDKGLTLYHNGTVIYHADTLSPFEVAFLPRDVQPRRA